MANGQAGIHSFIHATPSWRSCRTLLLRLLSPLVRHVSLVARVAEQQFATNNNKQQQRTGGLMLPSDTIAVRECRLFLGNSLRVPRKGATKLQRAHVFSNGLSNELCDDDLRRSGIPERTFELDRLRKTSKPKFRSEAADSPGVLPWTNARCSNVQA